MATYTEIPMVPEGTLDPAAGLNQYIYVNEATKNCLVESMADTSPPSLTGSGDKYIVGPGGTGLWSGMDDYLAIDKGTHWDFFAPELVRTVLDLTTGCQHYHGGASDGWLPVQNCGGS